MPIPFPLRGKLVTIIRAIPNLYKVMAVIRECINIMERYRSLSWPAGIAILSLKEHKYK